MVSPTISDQEWSGPVVGEDDGTGVSHPRVKPNWGLHTMRSLQGQWDLECF